jgi:hypothetical protein
MISQLCNKIFQHSVEEYHLSDNVDADLINPYSSTSFEHLLYKKNWIDTVQWHLEDIIREPSIDPETALKIKRRIDASNQERTDMVEYIDSYFLKQYSEIERLPGAKFNTESPAWAIDRLSILVLKIYHMQKEAERSEASEVHRNSCKQKLEILLQQQKDLSTAIDELLEEIAAGKKFMKVYKQMKMYNDPSLNPVLYAKKN